MKDYTFPNVIIEFLANKKFISYILVKSRNTKIIVKHFTPGFYQLTMPAVN